MTFDQLKLFRDIAQNRSVSRGAELNGVSQSAASQSLHELEKELKVRLLDRSTRPVKVTEAGRLFSNFCRDSLRRWEQFEAGLERFRGRVEGTVRVASIYSVGLSEMSRLEEEFARRLPEAELKVEYLRPEKVYEAVLADEADLGLVSYAESSKEIRVIPWREEEMVVATTPADPLARRGAVDVADLRGRDFIGFDEDLPVAREVKRFLRDHGVDVNLVMHFDNIQTMKEAVALGTGVSILPLRILGPDLAQGRLAAVRIQAPGLSRPLGIIHRRTKKLNRATQAFLALVREEPAPMPEPAPAGR